MVEIAPAAQLDPHLRDRLTADSVNLAKQVAVGYKRVCRWSSRGVYEYHKYARPTRFMHRSVKEAGGTAFSAITSAYIHYPKAIL